MNISTEQAKQLAENYTKAWCSHDADAVASFYAQEGFIVKNGAEPCVGRAEIAEMAKAYFIDFPDIIVKLDGVRSTASHAIFLWTFVGTNTGPEGTGNYVDVSGWEYWHFSEDGLIAESAGHFDVDDYQKQLDGV